MIGKNMSNSVELLYNNSSNNKKTINQVYAHTSFIGETGYANHSRNFFTALNKLIPVKVRNFAAGKTWIGLNNGEPHNNEWYLTDEHKEMLYKQTCTDADNGQRTDYYIYGGSEDDEKGNNLHIVLNETNHHYFYDKYEGIKIAYNVWESTKQPEQFFNKLLEFDYLWVPSEWQRQCSINQGYPTDRVCVVPEAVNGDIFFPDQNKSLDEYKDGRFKFILFGRWDYRKSTTEIISTFLKTFSKNEPVDLIVSIDNSFSSDKIRTTEDRLKYYGFSDDRIKVKHFPSREDYIKYMKSGDVFVSCARSEGWNLPLIEAMACGTPSIYSNWGAQLEFARDKGLSVKIVGEKPASAAEGSGYKMHGGDTPGNYCEPDFEDLGKVMRHSYENYDNCKRKAIGDSKKIIEEFSWENAAKKAFENLPNFEDKNIIVCNDGSNKIIVEKTANIKVSIEGDVGRDYSVGFFNIENGMRIYQVDIRNNAFAVETLPSVNYPSQIYVNVVSDNGAFFDFMYDSEKNVLSRINTVRDDSTFRKDSMELYQDQYVNGEVIEKGIRDCSSRYDVMKQVFDKYERPFTILDIGANFGYYSLRAVTEYDATAIMIESGENECSKLISLADRNNCKDRLIVLNKRINLYELKELAKCEHFDVVLALNVIHHFGDEDIEGVCEVFSNLGDNLIIETPPPNDKNACGGKHLKPINDFYSNREKMFLGSFDRHTCDGKSDIYWLETSKDKLASTYFEYDTLFTNGTVDGDMLYCLEKEDNIVNSTFTFKNIDNKNKNRTFEWIHGINLMTFIKLNGRYPEPNSIIDKIKNKNLTTGYKWNNENEDLVLHNIIVGGSELHLIDYDESMMGYGNLTDDEQIDIIIGTLRRHYKMLGGGIESSVSVNFVDGPFLEIKEDDNSKYDVEFIDKRNNEIVYSDTINSNNWARANRKWYTDWSINAYNEGELIYNHEFDLRNKIALISMDSKSLGDTIAWMPYVEEFRKKHKCKVFCSTFWNGIFEKEYPEIKFVLPGSVVDNIYASYSFGWYVPFEDVKNPVDFREIPLQKTASDILGLEYKEIKPKVTIPDKPRNIDGKYVCIGIHSTTQCKYWNYPGGWQEITYYLKEKGYKVVAIHKEQGIYMGNEPPNGIINRSGDIPIEDRMIDLKYADMFLGVSSGLSWLSWAVGTPTVIVSGTTKPYCEFTTGVQRIHNNTVCNGCLNDRNIIFDKGKWDWCPRKKSFECSKGISPEMVKVGINLILREKYGKF